MRDRGKISDKGKEQAASSGKTRDLVRAQAQARQEQSTVPEKEQGKVPRSRELRDFRCPLARGTREARAPRNTFQSSGFALRSTRSDGTSGLVASRSPENISLHDGIRKGMDQGETSRQQDTTTQQERIQQAFKAWQTKNQYTQYVEDMYEAGMINNYQYNKAYENIYNNYTDKLNKIKQGEN